MKLKNTWLFLDALIPSAFKNWLQNLNTQMRLVHFSISHPPPASENIAATTHLRNEAQYGLWYGAGIGLIIGLYILFFPLWITVSPAWYTHAPWYAILAITTLSCMLIAGCGAAVLGAHVSNRKLRTTNKNTRKASPQKTARAR